MVRAPLRTSEEEEKEELGNPAGLLRSDTAVMSSEATGGVARTSHVSDMI